MRGRSLTTLTKCGGGEHKDLGGGRELDGRRATLTQRDSEKGSGWGGGG